MPYAEGIDVRYGSSSQFAYVYLTVVNRAAAAGKPVLSRLAKDAKDAISAFRPPLFPPAENSAFGPEASFPFKRFVYKPVNPYCGAIIYKMITLKL